MGTDELVRQAEDVLADISRINPEDWNDRARVVSIAKEFLRLYAGEKSTFYRDVADLNTQSGSSALPIIKGGIEAFITHAKRGLLAGVSPERKAQIDVVSDILLQAQQLLADSKVHPAAPAMIIGAALEEFLRTWMEDAGLALGSKSPSIDSYCKTLREADLMTKQDVKDITSWAGTRNHAAHGEWDQVSDRSRIGLMLEGVNLFMRRYGPKE